MSCVWLLVSCTDFSFLKSVQDTLRGNSESKLVLVMCTHSLYIQPPLPPPPCHSQLQTNPKHTCMCTQIEIVCVCLNKTSRKLDSGKSSSRSNAGLIKMDVFFLHGYCDTMRKTQILSYMRRGCVGVCLVLEVGGVVDRGRRRSTLQPFLLLGKIALP